ncbi:MAG: LytTR family transcriptional regulator DNA-binding domain-containing protein [Actinomycetia bacterium]|nr:LytTR family transcriptional regulator DNA-binding domain-containing protein [Actinomycetes bacterium]
MIRLTTNKDPLLPDDRVDINYRELTSPIDQIIEICNQGDQILWGEIDKKKYPIDISDILYIEWVDGRTCICTTDNVYTSAYSLTQLEQLLSDKHFVRVSKPMIANIRKIKWLSSVLNMKLVAELVSGERIEVSRHYRGNLLDKILEIGRGG